MNAFKVNKKSWHYRLNELMFWRISNNVPKDFCTYWRHFVYSLLMVSVIAAAVAGFAVCVVFLLVTMILNPVHAGLTMLFVVGVFAFCLLMTGLMDKLARYLRSNPPPSLIQKLMKGIAMTFGGLIFLVFFPFLLVVYVLATAGSWLKSQKKQSSPKNPSIVYTKYRSLKDRICPMVEYESYEEKSL